MTGDIVVEDPRMLDRGLVLQNKERGGNVVFLAAVPRSRPRERRQ